MEGERMTKAVLMTVDDEPQVLNAIERDLRKQYGRDYRVMKAGSGAEALDTLRQLKQRNTPVALFLADQRMPVMSGTEFLGEAIKIYPDARKVLLTAYADTEAAITSINSIGLDFYLMKPWDPPEQNLFPVLDDLLSDWLATVDLPYEGIRVAGTLWSPSTHTVKDFLARNQIPYQWVDIETDEQTRTLIESLPESGSGLSGSARLPVVFFPDGAYIVAPSMEDLAHKVGLQTKAAHPFYDLIIIGGGPAGLAAAVYGGSEGLRTVMIEREATGGQAGTSSRIENYLGFPKGLSGADLARRAFSQTKRFGVEILIPQEVVSIRAEGPYRFVTLKDGTELSCHAVLISTGVSVRRLDAPGVDALTGAGVYYGAALTEAAAYRGKEVYVVGGANSAGQAAMYFSRYASTVHMLVRASNLTVSMSQYLIDQIADTPNIKVEYNVEVVEALGTKPGSTENRLSELVIANLETKETSRVPAAALFIFIGMVPRTEVFGEFLALDTSGFVVTGSDLAKVKSAHRWPLKRDPFLLETSVPGIFSAGDVRHGSVKRVASAVGEGAIAVSLIHQYLKTV
jgi:thioredoxin reductase (NADPH)